MQRLIDELENILKPNIKIEARIKNIIRGKSVTQKKY